MCALSLIWSENDPRTPFPDYMFVEDLKLSSLIRISTRTGWLEQPLRDFFTQESETIMLRSALFNELLSNRTLYQELRVQFQKVADLEALGKLKSEPDSSPEQSLYSIREIELYVELIEGLHALLEEQNVQSQALLTLKAYIDALFESESFAALRQNTVRQTQTISKAHSVTVGINLNAQFTPAEAGIVSINEEKFESGSVMHKLLRLDFKDDEYTCLTPLQPLTKGLSPMEAGMLNASFKCVMEACILSARIVDTSRSQVRAERCRLSNFTVT